MKSNNLDSVLLKLAVISAGAALVSLFFRGDPVNREFSVIPVPKLPRLPDVSYAKEEEGFTFHRSLLSFLHRILKKLGGCHIRSLENSIGCPVSVSASMDTSLGSKLSMTTDRSSSWHIKTMHPRRRF